MKTTKLFKTTLLVLFSACLLAFAPSTGMKATTHSRVIVVKTRAWVKSVKRHGQMDIWYFRFYASEGEFEVQGFGGTGSGSVENYIEGCIGGFLGSTGTVSGTYSIAPGGLATLNINVTPSGHSEFHFGGSPAAQGGTPQSITDCGQE